MKANVLFAVALAGASAAAFADRAVTEEELEARLTDVVARCATQYRALDKAATPLMRDAAGEFRTPHGWLKEKGALDMRSRFWWTAGHFPGSLWYLHELTGADDFRERAMAWTAILETNKTVTSNHDVGFITYCSFGNARRLLKTDRFDGILVQTARSLCRRYHEKLGLIRSWGAPDDKREFLVIPDNLMNLELLCFASTKGDKRFLKVAISHADVTMKHHYRADGGCYHVLDYDQTTGRVKGIMRGQGASCETAWARGQS